jgi:hypothetical protein
MDARLLPSSIYLQPLLYSAPREVAVPGSITNRLVAERSGEARADQQNPFLCLQPPAPALQWELSLWSRGIRSGQTVVLSINYQVWPYTGNINSPACYVFVALVVEKEEHYTAVIVS